MKEVTLSRHLVARRVWRPLAQLTFRVLRPLLSIPTPRVRYVPRGAPAGTQAIMVPLGVVLCFRCQDWLRRRACRARAVQLFSHSSFTYDLAAIGAALLAPPVRWERACRQKMILETDPRLRQP